MKNLKPSRFLYLILGVSALSWIILSLITKKSLSNFFDFIKMIPNIVTIDTVFGVIFTNWLWKCKIFKKWLVPYPNLNGTWTGLIYSSWINPATQKGVPPIPVMLTIKQSFSNISCLMQTTESKSYSSTEDFAIDDERQIKQLTYTYMNKPRIVLNNRSPAHGGTITFDIIEKPELKLRGSYYTERETKGEIDLTFHSKKLMYDLIPEINNHPVTEPENRRPE